MPGPFLETIKLDFIRTNARIYSYKCSLNVNTPMPFKLNSTTWEICYRILADITIEGNIKVVLSVKGKKDPTSCTDNSSSNGPIIIGFMSILNGKNEKIEKYSISFKIPPGQKFIINCLSLNYKTEFKPLLVNSLLHVSFDLVEINYDTNNCTNVDQKCDKLKEMFLESKFSDVKLLAKNGKELAAHKIILASRVPYFEKMFQSNMTESTSNTVKMADIEFNVVKEMLRFVYTGKVENMEDVVNDLIIAADKYLMENLKNHCEKYLCDSMCVENALSILELAYECNASVLKTDCIKFIKKNLAEITKSDKFREMTIGEYRKCEIFGDILRAFT